MNINLLLWIMNEWQYWFVWKKVSKHSFNYLSIYILSTFDESVEQKVKVRGCLMESKFAKAQKISYILFALFNSFIYYNLSNKNDYTKFESEM